MSPHRIGVGWLSGSKIGAYLEFLSAYLRRKWLRSANLFTGAGSVSRCGTAQRAGTLEWPGRHGLCYLGAPDQP